MGIQHPSYLEPASALGRDQACGADIWGAETRALLVSLVPRVCDCLS